MASVKRQLTAEINGLQIEGMPGVDKLIALAGEYVSLEYPLPGGAGAKFPDDRTVPGRLFC